MYKELAGRSLLPESMRRPELGNASMGIALAIVGIDPSKNGENISSPNIWTTIELGSKTATDRKGGQISIPADTRKIGESKAFNVLGSLAEFTESDNLIRSLSFMPSSFVPKAIDIKGNKYDLGVLFLNGLPTEPIVPFDVNEVAANGWMKLEDLQRFKNSNPSGIRSFVGQIIEKEGSEEQGIIRRAVADYFSDPDKRVSFSAVLPADFSIAKFYQRREESKDVLGASGVIFAAKK